MYSIYIWFSFVKNRKQLQRSDWILTWLNLRRIHFQVWFLGRMCWFCLRLDWVHSADEMRSWLHVPQSVARYSRMKWTALIIPLSSVELFLFLILNELLHYCPDCNAIKQTLLYISFSFCWQTFSAKIFIDKFIYWLYLCCLDKKRTRSELFVSELLSMCVFGWKYCTNFINILYKRINGQNFNLKNGCILN